MNSDISLETVLGRVTLSGFADNEDWRASLASVSKADGLEEIALSLETVSGQPLPPPQCTLSMRAPIRGAVACWTPRHVHFEMPLPWTAAKTGANAARDLPLYANVGPDGESRLVLAVSECIRRVAIRGAVDEFTADEALSVAFFTEPEDPVSRFSARIRIDVRVRPFHEALAEAAEWIDSFADSQLSPLLPSGPQVAAKANAPDAARRPWYSTWYSYHHAISPKAVVAEAREAKKLGMRGLLLDSGWDLRRPIRGVPPEHPSKVGDWKPDPAKIPDMRELARAVRSEGLSFVLWFALPFVGEHSRAWRKWKDKMLWERVLGGHKWGILDPRFPEVRAHLSSLFARVVRDWELDGLKLDFIDSFELRTSAPAEAPGAVPAPNLPQDDGVAVEMGPLEGRDFASVPAAATALMAEVSAAIKAVKPDAMVEFRQGYIGPAMRRFGNMLRASDCPSCIATNRFKTVDLRLTSCGDIIHGDMLEWDASGSAEDAALQLLAVLFAVPQISMRLAALPPRHRAMLRFWLRFWNAHRNTLLDAPFRPVHPEAAYPVVAAAGANETVTAVYQSGTVVDAWQDTAADGFVVNATASSVLTVRFASIPDSIETFDCTGKRAATPDLAKFAGLSCPFVADIPVPTSGLLVVKRSIK